MKRRIKDRIGLSLLFSFAVFIIFIITVMISGLISYLVITSNLGDYIRLRGPAFMLLVMMTSSIVIGTIVSFIVGPFSLKPIQKLIDATNQLAHGDFSVRLSIKRPAELRELGESFNRMANELGSIELLRTDFINNFSHEFKTPIVSIKGFAEILKNDDLTAEERNEYLDIVISESGRLAVLASNVLQLSRIENQNILSEKQAFDLSEQIRRCILIFETKWEEKKLSLSVDIQEITCRGNEDLLSQVWMNLIDNAVKFTPKNGNIYMMLRQAGEYAQFVIQDSGCGISEDSGKRIFDNFYQADSSHSIAGNGLGLTIAKKIVLLHGGSIEFRSEVDGGTEFTVLIPLK